MIKGTACSDGYGIGKVMIVRQQSLVFTPKINCNQRLELERYKSAVEDFCVKTKKITECIKKSVSEHDAQIISGQIMMIKDPYLETEIERLINEGSCAECAVMTVCDMFVQLFADADDELTNQRATDVIDIKNSVLSILLGIKEVSISDVPPDTILVAKNITPSMMAEIDNKNIIGIVTEVGGRTSHTAILARAMGIPAVQSVENAVSLIDDENVIIVDGSKGIVIINPLESQIDEYTRKHIDFIKEKKQLSKYASRKTLTANGIRIKLFGNIESPEDAIKISDFNGDGIGLFRTEFLYMNRATQPSEEEQFEAYKKVAVTMNQKPVIIRTLDIGGDKNIPYFNMSEEENPYLGFKAIRYCLKHKELFLTQLRALIRASVFGNIKIMIPMVTCVDELRSVRKLVQDIINEFDLKSIPYKKEIEIGVMIETAAAVLIADILAEEADFFSIGTNDLTQYTMSVDRGNSNVAYLYSSYNPAVLRSIKHVVSCAKKAGISVGMCGEAVADRFMIPLLISFGLDEFSVAPTSMLSVRKNILEWTKEQADCITETVMKFKTEGEVLNYLAGNFKIKSL